MRSKSNKQSFLFEELALPVIPIWKREPRERYEWWPFKDQLEYSIDRDLKLAAKAPTEQWATYYRNRAATFQQWLNEL